MQIELSFAMEEGNPIIHYRKI